ncbi:PP2C family protein-serine/threonine phosphatase [Gordonia shandongensis]|uniref:PP2C family protein-serine/threonine phosphatase n=1 Tax=Gordonia shandongensis TaxID=376351 RepID=UPI00041DB529|nr:protein phosphatase 2C domain-containing protein [Gordonia shandongensis]
MTLVLRYIARSDRGLVRSNNEDSVYAGARLLALADGMGGHAAGEVASQLVIGALRSLDNDQPGGDMLTALGQATAEGNAAIAAQVVAQPELEGMGTTLTAILFDGNRIGLCHVGDSRGYMYRGGDLTQITRDDTFVQTLVDEGRITPEQAHSHPQRSLIMRALTGQEVEPTLSMREARAGDRYLICSDGLSDVVSEETLADTLGSIADHRDCADRLIELALRSGGPDNVTVIVADVVDGEIGESVPILGGAAGDDDSAGYVPNPSTAAGRAAALRPPAPAPARPTIHRDDEPAPTRRWRLPIAIIAVLAVIAALVTAFFVVRAKTMASNFITAVDGNVEVYQGSPDTLLFVKVQSPSKRVCVDNLDRDKPDATLIDVDSDRACQPMRLDDLNQLSRQTVQQNSIKNESDTEIAESVNNLRFLPICPPPAPPAPHDPQKPRGPEKRPGGPSAHPTEPAPDSPGDDATASATLPASPTDAPTDTKHCREVR